MSKLALFGAVVLFPLVAASAKNGAGGPPLPPTVTITAGSTSLCLGSTTSITSSVTGCTASSYQWQYSFNNTTWSNITSATASTYTIPPLQAPTYYRMLVPTSSCGAGTSNSVYINTQCLGCSTLKSTLWLIDENYSQANALHLYSISDYGNPLTTSVDYGKFKYYHPTSGAVMTNIEVAGDIQAMAINRYTGEAYIFSSGNYTGAPSTTQALWRYNINDAPYNNGNIILTLIASITQPSDRAMECLAFDPTNRRFYTADPISGSNSSTSIDELYYFDLDDLNANVLAATNPTFVGPITGAGYDNKYVDGLELTDAGTLYAVDGTDDHLYRVNKTTGAIEALEDNLLDNTSSNDVESMAWDSRQNRLIAVDNSGEQLVEITLGSNGSNVIWGDFTGLPSPNGSSIDMESAAMYTICPNEQTRIGNVIFLDGNSDGNFDSGEGINGVRVELFHNGDDPLTAAPTAYTTTANGGQYLFQYLEAGTYFVFIPPSEFQYNKPLYQMVSVPGNGTDSGVDDGTDENGIDAANPAATGIRSTNIVLNYNTEPTNGSTETGTANTLDDADDNNGDMTVDFGFRSTTCSVAACSGFGNYLFNQTPTQIANPSGMVGDKWRFPTVATGLDALVEIMAVQNISSLQTIDASSGTTELNNAWAPEINVNKVPGADSYVDWKITIVNTGTTTPATLSQGCRMTSFDVDGNNTVNEIHGHIAPNGYVLNNPTEVEILDEAPYTVVKGGTIEHSGLTTDPEVKAMFYYPSSDNEFNIRLGCRSVTSSGTEWRQFALSFNPCQSWTATIITPVSPVITGPSAVCVTAPNSTYSTTGIFSSYTWSVSSGGTIVSGQGTQNVVVNWTSAGARAISVSVTDGNGCNTTSGYNVTVVANPTVTASNTGPYCAGATIQLNATPSGGTSPYTWLWAGPLSFSSTAQNPTRSASTAGMSGTYTVTLTDNNACTATASTAVTVNANLSFTTQPTSGSNCGSTAFTINAIAPASAAYQWQYSPNNSTWSNVANGTPTGATYSGATTTALTVSGITSWGAYSYRCVASASGCVTVASSVAAQSVLSPPVVAAGGNNLCLGQTLNLTASVTGGTSPFSFQWSGPLGFSSTAQNPSFLVLFAGFGGTYNVSVTDNNGCTGQSSKAITVSSPPPMPCPVNN